MIIRNEEHKRETVEGLLGGKVAWHIERPICRKDTDAC